MPKIVPSIFRVSEIVLEQIKLRSIEMTTTGIILIVLLIGIVGITMKKAVSINLSDIERIELDELDRDNIN